MPFHTTIRSALARALLRALLASTSLIGALSVGATAHAADDIPSLLRAADRYRSGGVGLQVETEVTVLQRDGRPDKTRLYTVFVQDQRRSLVLMRSPAEQGQKVLMLGDDFWLLMPGSQRPLRITPSQKLLGDASTGDIATLNWADDYAGTLVGEERCTDDRANAASDTTANPPGEQACLHLTLQAQRKGVSYQRIELWLGKAKHEPLKADLYVQSDKLAKQARFIVDQPKAPTRVEEMVLLDRLSNHKETRVRYLSRQNKTVPDTWLNPMFLARNPALE